MSIDASSDQGALPNRRQLLQKCGTGLGMLGLGALCADDARADSSSSLLPKQPHFPGKIKRVIHLFMNGGPSQVDTFDYKPALQKWAGKKLPNPNLATERPTGAAFPSPFRFKRYGESGIHVSELFQHTAKHVDDMAIINSMYADVPNHEPSLMLMNCGATRQVRPSMGSWVTYGLGTENQNLPGFIALCPDGYPIKETQNWQAGFLPGIYQGTRIDTRSQDVNKLVENIHNSKLSKSSQREQIDVLQKLNRLHAKARASDPQLEARIQSFELAYRMQDEATEAFDISREPKYVREAYGDHVQGRQILIARRLVERGVRFVQVWHGKGQPWDHHDDIEVRHRKLAQECDQPIAALLQDLKDRGLLEETLVVWGGEFGRTPVVELPKAGSNQGKINGRDHNHWGFTVWMAGGGIKGGTVHGSTDEFGFKAQEDRVHVFDLHATILHLLGFDHERLTYRYAGRDYRLTDVHGKVIENILA